MFGVSAEPPVGSGAAAKGLVAFCLSYVKTQIQKYHFIFFKNLQLLELCNIPPGKLKKKIVKTHYCTNFLLKQYRGNCLADVENLNFYSIIVYKGFVMA